MRPCAQIGKLRSVFVVGCVGKLGLTGLHLRYCLAEVLCQVLRCFKHLHGCPQHFEREFALLFVQQRSSPCPFGPLQYFNEFAVNRLVDKIPLTAADIRPASGQTIGEDVDLQGIAEGTGIQLDPQMAALMTDIREQLGINSCENA